MEPILDVRGLATHFVSEGRTIHAVDGIDFSVGPAETLGIVGETGSGKSATALSILRLIPSPPGRIVGGRIIFKGRDLLSLDERSMRSIRGREIAMIFQEPRTSMNPAFRIGQQMEEVLVHHLALSGRDASRRVVELLERVHIADPGRVAHAYPHELSGGMLQRVMIAMQLSGEPALLIADEPTTALDVTMQAQILRLLRDLQQKRRLAMLLITHDLGVVAQTCDRVAIMYAGRIVEEGPVETVFLSPRHPYTSGLLDSIPSLDRSRSELPMMAGGVPDLTRLGSGCRFRGRCAHAQERCASNDPALKSVGTGHKVACFVFAGSGTEDVGTATID